MRCCRLCQCSFLARRGSANVRSFAGTCRARSIHPAIAASIPAVPLALSRAMMSCPSGGRWKRATGLLVTRSDTAAAGRPAVCKIYLAQRLYWAGTQQTGRLRLFLSPLPPPNIAGKQMNKILVSDDGGSQWRMTAALDIIWPSLFAVDGVLYCIGNRRLSREIIIARSEDCGERCGCCCARLLTGIRREVWPRFAA